MSRAVLAFLLGLLFGTMFYSIQQAYPKEGDDHGNHGDLKQWFDGLRSQHGMCCSFADGMTLKDVEWDMKDNHYRARIPAGSIKDTQSYDDGTYKELNKPDQDTWVDIPDNAVITEPNRFGQAVVWPYWDPYAGVQIRCFIPGAGT